jgi:predicted GH43/DUF377 family glycosyl hydrolase
MPHRGRDGFHRYENNPILSVEDIPFRANTVFNGTPAKVGDEYLLLLRVEGQRGYSFFALARSQDGLNFTVDEEPVLLPASEGVYATYETHGIEDPRATYLDGVWYVMYTAASAHGHRIAVAKTQDFVHFERIALASDPGNKDGVLFPEKINGCYCRLDRPIGFDVGSIWVSYSPDLYYWGRSQVVIRPRPGFWDSFRIGASAPPIRTDEGWLEIYHGVRMTSAGPIYRAGTVLLDLEDPAKVVAQCSVPLLAPREEYERVGDVGNVVFACGAIVEPDGELKMYYGGADTHICVATARLDDIVQRTLTSSAELSFD